MGLSQLPNEVFLIILSFLDLEDQFNLGLTCFNFFQFIGRSDRICKAALRVRTRLRYLQRTQYSLDQEKAPFAPEYLEAHCTGAYATAWRRFVKRRVALRTATPFHLSVVGAGLRFALCNDVLIYKPTQNEIRLLFLDGSTTEEIHIQPRRLAKEALPHIALEMSELTVDPLYYADGIASFSVQSAQLHFVVFCDVWSGKILGTDELEQSNALFVRNNGNYLYYGCWRLRPEYHWTWWIKIYDLAAAVWSEEKGLDPDFAGADLGNNVCFEIIDDYFYGVSTAHSPVDPESTESELEPDSYYNVFRHLVGSEDPAQYLPRLGLWRRHWHEGSIDTRFNDLKLVKDEETGGIFVYEVRKEWTPRGHSVRNCYRRELRFGEKWEPDISPSDSPSSFLDEEPIYTQPQGKEVTRDSSPSNLDEESRYTSPQDKEDCHVGDSGLSHTESDSRRLQAFSYNTTTRTFLDILCTSSIGENRDRLCLRARAMVAYKDDSLPNVSWKGDTDIDNPHLHFWPPSQKEGSGQVEINVIRTLFSPRQGLIEKIRWASNDRFFIFSSILKESSTELGAIILLSFDPGFKLHGLKRLDGSSGQVTPDFLTQLPPRGDADGTKWAHRVRPFHLLIKSAQGQHYGFDFTH